MHVSDVTEQDECFDDQTYTYLETLKLKSIRDMYRSTTEVIDRITHGDINCKSGIVPSLS